MSQFKARYTFKGATMAKLLESGAKEAEVKDSKLFEALTDDAGAIRYKRKSLDISLQEPEILANVSDPLIKSLVLAEVKAFVKAKYLEFFQPIGEHSWELVTKWREESGRQASDDDLSSEDKAAAASVFRAYWNAQPGKQAVAELFAELCSEGCSWAATKRLITPKGKTISAELIQRYVDKFTELAEALKADGHQADADRLESLAAILSGHIDSRFEKADPASAW